jgi:hypothetical protein
MNPSIVITSNKKIYYRLIALWAVCEGFLGGIIFSFKLPVSGLLVGGAAIICISLIAHYVPAKGSIIKATIIVAVFKMMLSPHSPPPAYIAVFFQGLMGELLFINKKYFKVSCLLLAIVAMVESALQRIFVLTILYGTNFWKAVNQFINGLTHEKEVTNYSLMLAGLYLLLHVVAGIIIGIFTGKLPKKIASSKNKEAYLIDTANTAILSPKTKKKKGIKTSLLIIWIILIALYIQSNIPVGKPLLSSDVVLQILVRSALIILGWYLVLSPLIMQWLKRWLEKKQGKFKEDIQQILTLLPSTKKIIEKSWNLSAAKKGFARIGLFSSIVLMNILHE